MPPELHVIAWISLGLGGVCALVIAGDEMRRPQPMWIMNLVWPVTALFGSLIWLGFYLRFGRAGHAAGHDKGHDQPFAIAVAKGASHCGAGCTLGDLVAENLALMFPALVTALGWHHIFADRMFAVWILDFVVAYGFGVFFQYFTIAPMRNLGLWQGLWAAIRADTLSLCAWQIGMYGFMAVAHFWLFPHLIHAKLPAASPEFWFMMQIAMICGFITSYPVNWWLIRAGFKEAM